MYVASNTNKALRGEGELHVFAANDPGLLPNDLTVNRGVAGHWVPVPDAVALDAAALNAYADDPKVMAFPFIRLEDGFYDKRPGASPAAYFYDTGRGSITDPSNGAPIDPWGSIYRVDFEDPRDPAGGTTTLTLLARSTGPEEMWASPDNGDMNANGVVMLQEDPANGPWEPSKGARPPAIFALQLNADGTLADPYRTRIAQVVDGDCSPTGAGDCWETSGIVDASAWFGPGAWIFDVQAHKRDDDTNPVPGCPDCQEAGQILLAKIH